MMFNKNWFLAMRPWSFSMSAISVSVGAAFAATHGSFSWSLYLLSAVAMIALHGGVNLMNDFFDYRSRLLYSDRALQLGRALGIHPVRCACVAGPFRQ